MRASGNEIGRFDPAFEIRDIKQGITYDLTSFVGSLCDWWVYSTTTLDSIYDVGVSTGTGRTWASPLTLVVTRNLLERGTNEDRGSGFYNVDSLHLTFNMADVISAIPDIMTFPDNHSKDRVVYDGQVYRPTSVHPRGVVGMQFVILAVELVQIHKEELVNDPQFQSYAPA